MLGISETALARCEAAHALGHLDERPRNPKYGRPERKCDRSRGEQQGADHAPVCARDTVVGGRVLALSFVDLVADDLADAVAKRVDGGVETVVYEPLERNLISGLQDGAEFGNNGVDGVHESLHAISQCAFLSGLVAFLIVAPICGDPGRSFFDRAGTGFPGESPVPNLMRNVDDLDCVKVGDRLEIAERLHPVVEDRLQTAAGDAARVRSDQCDDDGGGKKRGKRRQQPPLDGTHEMRSPVLIPVRIKIGGSSKYFGKYDSGQIKHAKISCAARARPAK